MSVFLKVVWTSVTLFTTQYLSPMNLQESLQAFEARNKNREPLVRIMGRIVLIDTKVSTLEENPYNLLPGSTYYVCYVEPLKLKGVKKRAAAALASVGSPSHTSVVTGAAGGTPLSKGGNEGVASNKASPGSPSADVGTGAAVATEGTPASTRTLSVEHPSVAGGVLGEGGGEGGAGSARQPRSGEKVRDSP
jgi:hypothetical protein